MPDTETSIVEQPGVEDAWNHLVPCSLSSCHALQDGWCTTDAHCGWVNESCCAGDKCLDDSTCEDGTCKEGSHLLPSLLLHPPPHVN